MRDEKGKGGFDFSLGMIRPAGDTSPIPYPRYGLIQLPLLRRLVLDLSV